MKWHDVSHLCNQQEHTSNLNGKRTSLCYSYKTLQILLKDVPCYPNSLTLSIRAWYISGLMVQCHRLTGLQYLGGCTHHGWMGLNQTVPFLVLTASLDNILVVASLGVIACSAFSNMLGPYSVCLKIPKKVEARVPGVTLAMSFCFTSSSKRVKLLGAKAWNFAKFSCLGVSWTMMWGICWSTSRPHHHT